MFFFQLYFRIFLFREFSTVKPKANIKQVAQRSKTKNLSGKKLSWNGGLFSIWMCPVSTINKTSIVDNTLKRTYSNTP